MDAVTASLIETLITVRSFLDEACVLLFTNLGLPVHVVRPLCVRPRLVSNLTSSGRLPIPSLSPPFRTVPGGDIISARLIVGEAVWEAIGQQRVSHRRWERAGHWI